MAQLLKSKKTGVIFGWNANMAAMTDEYEVINTQPDVAYEKPPEIVDEPEPVFEVPQVEANDLDVNDS